MAGLFSWFKGLFAGKTRSRTPSAERVRRAVESIVENETLTDNLDDKAAQVLLDWGVACAEMIAQSTVGLDDERAEAEIYQRMRALRRMLRAVNRWIPRRLDMSDEEKLAALEEVIGLASQVYGPSFTFPDGGKRLLFLAGDAVAAPSRAIQGLRQLLEGKGERE